MGVIVSAAGGQVRSQSVTGPVGQPVDAPVAWLEDGRRVVEMATASGLGLIDRSERNALNATSFGTGELLKRALDGAPSGGATIVGIGGSASTDGGVGAAEANGWGFFDESGKPIGRGGGALRRLARIERPSISSLPPASEIIGACDVDSPLTGVMGAAHGFSAQKGASPPEVDLLAEGLEVLSHRIEEDLGFDVSREPGSGAGGGMGAGLVAFFDARLVSGFDVVADAIDLAGQVAGADLVITGEGRLDVQSLRGKATVGVVRIARKLGVPVVAIAGTVDLAPEVMRAAGFRDWISLGPLTGASEPQSDPAGAVSRAASELLRRFKTDEEN